MWFVRLALRRTYTFVVVALLIAVLGAVSIYRMSTDIFPNIDIPVISTVWQFTGMPADEIESRIILVTERVLTASVNGIEHIESQSLDGVGVVRIYFQPGAPIAEAEAQVTATCQTLLKTMPTGITPPYIVRYSATSVPILQIAVSSETLTEQQILDYCQNFVIQQLGTVQGARVPQPWGGKQRQVMVYLDLDRLYARGLSPQDVSTAISNQNLIIPAGTAKIGDTEYNVRLNSSPDLIEAFNNMPVKTVNGVPIYFKDVAHVADGYAVQTNVVRRDGRRAVLMTILKGDGASTLSVVQRVRDALPGIEAQLPPELKLEPLFDQSVFVRAAVQGVLKEGAIAAGLTALMILLFLGSWRSTLIVATSIPLSILTSVSVLWVLGHSLNTMTLGGMALAVGILVDDATVEIENVHRNLAMKKPLRRAILDGAAQIATPAFVSTLSICIVFVPVVFLTGPAAYLFTPLALAVVFAMLASYFLSRTLVPTMVLYLLPKEAEAEARRGHEEPAPQRLTPWSVLRHPSLVHDAFNRGFERLRLTYHGFLDFALDHRFVAITVLLGFALGSLALFPRIGQDFFPSVDAGQIRLHVRAPAGTRIEATERIFGQVEDAIRAVVPDSERAMILDNLGLTQSFTIMAYVDNGTVSDADGEILVALQPVHRPTADYVAQLRRELPQKFPQCTFFFEPADITSQVLNFGLPAPIDVQVVGINREGNLAVAQKLRQEMISAPDVDAQLAQAQADLAQARANLPLAEANAELAKVTLKRYVDAGPGTGVTLLQVDQQRATIKTTAAQVEATKASIQVYEASVQRYTALQGFQKIVAPFPGVITARNVDPGDLISADSPSTTKELFHLMRTDTLRVFVNVPQVFATGIKVGQDAVVYRQEELQKKYPGKVTRTADALDASTRTLLTEVDVPNPNDTLRPGMYLQVKFVFGRQFFPILIPAAALVTRTGGQQVAVLDTQHRVQYRTVQLGRDFGAEIEVIAGMKAGETVVVHPGDALPEGTVVEPVPPSK